MKRYISRAKNRLALVLLYSFLFLMLVGCIVSNLVIMLISLPFFIAGIILMFSTNRCPHCKVLDVGAAPGSWTMYILKMLGDNGFLSAIDLKPLNITIKKSNFFFIQGDAFDQENIQKLAEKGPYNAVVSDAAPSTTGNKIVDTERSIQLIESIYNTALQVLLPGGNFVFKMFQGGKEKEILDDMRKHFNAVKILKPQASRTNSFETFVIGLGKKA